ncbi:MAG TPA: flagellar assembly protein FliH [Accumulibacter sp.]|jgi:flagellar assembly protein FliH|nr:flagellar assembly protein FliH [Accumulibacter sp.]HQC79545.1 flagellar assembly protein FliH [Accumulibacter sp.]
MSRWIPKENLTAYQRWEIAAFDEQQRAAEEQAPPEDPPDEPLVTEQAPIEEESPPAPPTVPLPTAEEIEQIHREAHVAGYAAGYQEGITAAQEVADRIEAVMSGLQHALHTIDQGVADQLLALSIEIARQVLRQSLRVKPELLLPVVREAVTTLHAYHGGHPLLFVHPDDAALVRAQLGDQLSHGNWRIIDDPTLTAGGCRVELGASEVDATLETRWRRVVEAIGVSHEWLQTEKEPASR